MFDTRASTSLYSNGRTLSRPLQHPRHQHFASRTASRRSHGVGAALAAADGPRGPFRPGRPHTTYANSAARTSSNGKENHTATTPEPKPRERSRPYSPYESTSSHPLSPASAGLDSAANPQPGLPSTATTRPCASTCKTCSHTSESPASTQPRRHRQHFVDR